ncbi:hypothetical protein [Saccharopolyspora gloriosae]|uniref:hypothetical protein n=1 Tax=Saccharopolyspora gloriosae TaxID=455344 RepID=UPI001FB616B8|nr:hypothetical protein [Saccharopolyspora gloriosae]
MGIAPRGRPPTGLSVPEEWKLSASGGPRPFVTWARYDLPDSSGYLWESRRQRKGRGPERAGAAAKRGPWSSWWAPDRLAWWIAIGFMLGSALFIAGAWGSLVPHVFGGEHQMSLFAESCYCTGAVLYTVSIYGQILESLNSDDRIGPDRTSHPPERFRWIGFEPRRIEFMTPAVVFVGSVVFNYETVVALGATLDLLPRLWLWETSMVGSFLFLASSCMQIAEAGHGYVRFKPRDISWWVGVCFVLGSIGFVVGTVPGLDPPGLPTAAQGGGAAIVKIGFLVGGIFFLIGSYLMVPEMFTQLRNQGRPGKM